MYMCSNPAFFQDSSTDVSDGEDDSVVSFISPVRWESEVRVYCITK